MGHFCRICGRHRSNESFSGHGHRTHVCRDCRRLPVDERRAIEAHAEIAGFLDRQSHIPRKNVARLKELTASTNAAVAAEAAVMLEVARVAPHRRKRIGRIRAAHPDLWQRMVAAELVGPDPVDEIFELSAFPGPGDERGPYDDEPRWAEDAEDAENAEDAEAWDDDDLPF